MPQQQIRLAMQQLAAEGKAITTAAVRARLTAPVPLSELLALVSRYKQAPDSLAPLDPTIHVTRSPLADVPHAELLARLQTLEQSVAEQALRLAHLERLLMAR